MFREHIAIGAVISMVVVVAVYFYALVTDPLLLAILFGVTILGSFLPDVDSDSGMPFYLVYGTTTLAATGVVLLYVLSSSYAADWRYLAGIPLVALAFFWFVVGGVLKKCTHHRGIFHSLPAMVIAGLATFLIAEQFGLNDLVSLVFAPAMAVGFASHLVLDEMHSLVDLEGIPFIPKKSLGTALKLFSDSKGVNMATYVVLAALVYTAFGNPLRVDAFYNDSDIIELEDDAPPAPPDNGGEGTGDSSGTGSGAGQGGVVSEGGSTPQGSSNSGDGEAGGTTDGGDGGTGSGSGGTGSSGSAASDEELLDALVGEGIISGSGAVSGSSLFEDSVVGGSGGSVTVDGEGVRRYFRGKYDLQELLLGWRAGTDARLSSRGLGYVAASTALRDRNVDAVAFSADSFEIRYRSRGYLLSVIPITFPVQVSVFPELSSGRVTVKLPWYRFFVREFFTARGLAEDVDAVVEAEIEKNTNADADLKAALFVAVAEYLRTKVGTVSNTVVTQ